MTNLLYKKWLRHFCWIKENHSIYFNRYQSNRIIVNYFVYFSPIIPSTCRDNLSRPLHSFHRRTVLLVEFAQTKRECWGVYRIEAVHRSRAQVP